MGVNNDSTTEHINERLLEIFYTLWRYISQTFSSGTYSATKYTPIKYTLQAVQPFEHSYQTSYFVYNQIILMLYTIHLKY